MPFEVLLSDDAEQDIEDIYRFIAAREGGSIADRILANLEDACAKLAELPERGNVPKELHSIGITEYREIHDGVYRIIYRIAARRVIVYCVVDGRRDMQSLLQRRLLR